MSLKAEGKTLKSLLYAGAFALGAIFLPGCEPEESEPPVKKSIEQSVVLNNDVEIKYSATLSNVNSAQLNVKKEGVSISTEQISDVSSTGADYQKTYSYNINPNITKGNYEFTLTSDNLEKKNSVQIQNYKPTGDFTNLNLGIDYNSEINVTLPNTSDKISDKNPEDNPVPYTNAKSLDGKTSLILNGNNLKIKSLPNSTGGYQVELEYGSTGGGLEKSVLQGNIAGHTWKYTANPFVQPNDTTKPIIWNNFTTISQRSDYFYDRYYNYDMTDTITAIPNQFVCTDFASVLAINFNGYLGLPPDSRGLYTNNWHNIPMYTITLMKPVSFHQVAGVVVGDDFTNINNWKIVNGESDYTYSLSNFNQMGVYKMVVNYTFVKENDIQGKFLSFIPMFEFIPDGNGGWKDSGYRSPDINLITKRK